MDVVEFKRKNWIKQGDSLIMAKALGEGREGFEQIVQTSALPECVDIGLRAMQWDQKRGQSGRGADQARAGHGDRHARLRDRRAGHGRGEHQDE